MPMITRSVRLTADADTVWDVVGDFGRIDAWLPGASRPTVRRAGPDPDTQGVVATLEPAAPEVERVYRSDATHDETVERLIQRNDRVRRLMYTIPEPRFPAVDDYRASLLVRPLGACCEVVWTAAFRADAETVAALDVALGDDVFDVGLGALAERFGEQ